MQQNISIYEVFIKDKKERHHFTRKQANTTKEHLSILGK